MEKIPCRLLDNGKEFKVSINEFRFNQVLKNGILLDATRTCQCSDSSDSIGKGVIIRYKPSQLNSVMVRILQNEQNDDEYKIGLIKHIELLPRRTQQDNIKILFIVDNNDVVKIDMFNNNKKSDVLLFCNYCGFKLEEF